jgi:hypothetical protein
MPRTKSESQPAASYKPPPAIAKHLGSLADQLPKATVIPGEREKEVFLAVVPLAKPIEKMTEVLYFETTHLDLDTDGSTESWGETQTEGKTHQGHTSLDNFLKDKQTTDSNVIPYFVLPSHDAKGGWVGKDHHVGIGDLGVIINDKHVVFALYGDAGPHTKLGEASIQVHRAFGQEVIKGRKKVLDTDMKGPFVTIVFPGSGAAKKRLSPEEIEKHAKELFLKIGGKV